MLRILSPMLGGKPSNLSGGGVLGRSGLRQAGYLNVCFFNRAIQVNSRTLWQLNCIYASSTLLKVRFRRQSPTSARDLGFNRWLQQIG